MKHHWDKGVRGASALQLINSDDTTIRVEAGPGTGKTFSLVRRVQRILHPDGLNVRGREVLIVAFNRVIAKQLREDVEHLLANSPHDGDPIIRTVHALCLQAIGKPVRPLLPHEREAMLYDVLTTKRAFREQYARHSDADQALRDHEAKLAKHLSLWQAVRHWLTRHDAHLISDLPGLLLDSIHGGDYEGHRYQHVIVDEFQDLTPGEQRLFASLRRPKGHFVALGDSKQSIYRFRGNDREGLRNLENLLASRDAVTDIPMLECRRCPAPMVQAANQLMALYPPPMESPNADPASIHVVHWKTPQAEAKGLGPHIIANVRANPNDRHLVMVTRRRFGYWLRDHIHEIDPKVRVDLSFSESLLETWPVREAFLYFTLLVDPDPPTWRAWFAYENSPPAETPNAPKRNAGAYLQFLDACADEITLARVEALAEESRSRQRGQGGKALWDRAKRLLKLRTVAPLDTGGPAVELVKQLFADRLWLPRKPDPTAVLDLQLLRTKSISLLDDMTEANSDSSSVDHVRELARRLRYMIATREPFLADEACDLQVATLWGAKGVTADHVYIMGLCDEAIPGTRRPEYPGTKDDYEEEQRRLFYVSLTRSKRTLVLSRAKRMRPGDGMQLGIELGPTRGRWADLRMSRFLRDVIDVLPASVRGTDWPGCS